jgi:hypothetical protein
MDTVVRSSGFFLVTALIAMLGTIFAGCQVHYARRGKRGGALFLQYEELDLRQPDSFNPAAWLGWWIDRAWAAAFMLPEQKMYGRYVVVTVVNMGQSDIIRSRFDDDHPICLRFAGPIRVVHFDQPVRWIVVGTGLKIGPCVIPQGRPIRLWMRIEDDRTRLLDVVHRRRFLVFVSTEMHYVCRLLHGVIEDAPVRFRQGLVNPRKAALLRAATITVSAIVLFATSIWLLSRTNGEPTCEGFVDNAGHRTVVCSTR